MLTYNNYHAQGVTQFLEFAGFMQALSDMLNSKNAQMDEQQAQALAGMLQQRMQAQHQEQQALIASASKAEGKAFLETNGKRKGVHTTTTGLQYEVIVAGTGKSPTSTSKVTVHYTGTLIDGTKFDSSVDRGEPATFVLYQVIVG
jgi:FKBP-type peptidyl-prolyl cis-trans isomerase